MRLAVICGHARSAKARAMITLLSRQGHEISLCLNRRILTPSLFKTCYRDLGFMAPWVMVQYATGWGNAAACYENQILEQYLYSRRVFHQSIKSACREADAQLVNVIDLNGNHALEALKEHACDLVVYVEGGLLSRDFLRLAGQGVLNAHPGPLPKIRGKSPIEWCLYYGIRPEVTVHFLNHRVDQGPILLRRTPDYPPGCSLGGIRGRMMVASIEALLEGVKIVATGNYSTIPQHKRDGVIHYAMHPFLMQIVERRLGASVENGGPLLTPSGIFTPRSGRI